MDRETILYSLYVPSFAALQPCCRNSEDALLNFQKRYPCGMNSFLSSLFMLSLLTFGLPSALMGQKVKMSTQKPVFAFNDKIELEYSIDIRADSSQAPLFENFIQVGGPNISNSMTIKDGKREIRNSIYYILRAKKGGKYKLPPISFWVDGKAYKPKSVKIKIKEGELSPSDLAEFGKQNSAKSRPVPLGSKRYSITADNGFMEQFKENGWTFVRMLTDSEFLAFSSLEDYDFYNL